MRSQRGAQQTPKEMEGRSAAHRGAARRPRPGLRLWTPPAGNAEPRKASLDGHPSGCRGWEGNSAGRVRGSTTEQREGWSGLGW